MSRLAEVFRKKKPLIIYTTAGDPSLPATGQLILELADLGVDIVELGIPFSDPLADGPVIQASHSRALKAGATLPRILQLIKTVRKRTQIPLVLMGDYNLFYNYGLEKFGQEALAYNIDGVVIPNLPPEEARELVELGRNKNFSTIFLAALTSSEARLAKITELSTGFIYLVAVKGVTGSRQALDQELFRKIAQIKKMTAKPVAVGFGISTPEQARQVLARSDGLIIGSSFVKNYNDSPQKGLAFIKKILKGIKT